MTSESTDPLFSELQLSQVAEAVFNKAACSDVTLLVNESQFYCHRAVIARASHFVDNCIDWSSNKKNNGDHAESNLGVQIDLPEIRFPDAFSSAESNLDPVFWFENYLKLVYGFYKPMQDDIQEIFAIVQIADFMISPSVISFCDYLLKSIAYDKKTVLSVAIFCQKYSLPRTMETVKGIIAEDPYTHRENPLLYELEKEHFGDIVRMADPLEPWTFWIIVCYACGVIPEGDDIRSRELRIQDAEMVDFFQNLVQEISENWNRVALDWIFEDLEHHIVTFDPAESDPQFLYKTIAASYYRLSQQSEILTQGSEPSI